MMKIIKFGKKITALILCIIMLWGMVLPMQVQALQSDKEGRSRNITLRVAYYPLTGFFEYDEDGNEVGYGVELLDMISKYSGIEFEYVAAESWKTRKKCCLKMRQIFGCRERFQ